MTGSTERVRLELLRPSEIAAAIADNPTVYLPLGSIEWHSHHLPVGLDGLTAHGVCIAAALEGGGLVYPPLYFGTGGGHGDYPWTVMMPTEEPIVTMIEHSLTRLSSFGVRRVVLFSGHFADEQLAMIAAIERRWNAAGSGLSVVARSIDMTEGTDIEPDHAGVFETTMLHALWPERIELAELVGSAGEADVRFGPDRHDPAHPLWGVFGPDPRGFEPSASSSLLTAAARWLAAQASG